MKQVALVVGLLAVLFIAVGVSGLASEKRVAVFVQVSTPPSSDLNGERIAENILRMVLRNLEATREMGIVAPEEANAVLHRLGIGPDPSPREIRALARALKVDRVVFLRVAVRDHFTVAIHAAAFAADGHLVFEMRTSIFAPRLEEAIERAVRTLLDRLVPALLRP
jgi:hypothetical protein